MHSIILSGISISLTIQITNTGTMKPGDKTYKNQLLEIPILFFSMIKTHFMINLASNNWRNSKLLDHFSRMVLMIWLNLVKQDPTPMTFSMFQITKRKLKRLIRFFFRQLRLKLRNKMKMVLPERKRKLDWGLRISLWNLAKWSILWILIIL